MNWKFWKRDKAQYLYGMKIDDRPDPQQIEVYAWQHRVAFRDEHQMVLRFGAIVELVKNVCEQHGIETPTIDQGLLDTPAYDEEGHGLYFPRGANLWMVIHELGHVIQTARYGRNVQGHGPEYMQCYIELLAELRGTGTDDLFLSAIRYGLTVKGLKQVPLWDYPEWAFLTNEDYSNAYRNYQSNTRTGW